MWWILWWKTASKTRLGKKILSAWGVVLNQKKIWPKLAHDSLSCNGDKWNIRVVAECNCAWHINHAQVLFRWWELTCDRQTHTRRCRGRRQAPSSWRRRVSTETASSSLTSSTASELDPSSCRSGDRYHLLAAAALLLAAVRLPALERSSSPVRQLSTLDPTNCSNAPSWVYMQYNHAVDGGIASVENWVAIVLENPRRMA